MTIQETYSPSLNGALPPSERHVANLGALRVPFTIQTPTEIVDPVPLLLINGYLGIEASAIPLRNAVAALGKPAITYKLQRGSLQHMLSLDHHRHPEKIHAQAAHAVMRTVCNTLQLPHIDVAPHSMGGLAVASLNDDALQYMRQLHLLAPVGIGTLNINRLRSGIRSLISQDVVPLLQRGDLPITAEGIGDTIRYIINPLRLATDALAITACDTRARLQAIRTQHGIPVTATWFAQDVIVDPHEGHARAQGVVSRSHIFEDTNAGHSAPMSHATPIAQHLHDLAQEYATASS